MFVLYLEPLALRNRPLSSLILLVHPLSLQIPISILEGPNQTNLITLLDLPSLAHVLLLITLQFNRMFLMRVTIPAQLRLFSDSLQVRLTPLLEDALHRYFDIFQSAEILAQLDIDRRGMRFACSKALAQRFFGGVLLHAFPHAGIIYH